MDLVQLIILVCSLSDPTACSERTITFESHGSLERCMMEAPPYLAQWVGEHPDVRVSRWRCAWPGAEGEKS